MAYNEKYKKDLIEIIKLIDTGGTAALDKFKAHISEVINIGRYSAACWSPGWTKSVYEFGMKFKERNPQAYLDAITSEKEGRSEGEQEVLDFYCSEIEWNSLTEDLCADKTLKVVEKYPYNPEFSHTLGHLYLRNKEYKKAMEYYEFALEKNKFSVVFLESLFLCYKVYLENLIDKSEYKKGKDLCQEILRRETFLDNAHLHNFLLNIKERFKDHILLNQKILDAGDSITKIVNKETSRSQFKLIEILGFFTAIVALIFSTVSIGKNFSFNEAVIFNISLGIILLLFVVTINLLFGEKKVGICDFRIWLFIILIFSLLLIITKFGIPIWL